jgi:hypothetical protein
MNETAFTGGRENTVTVKLVDSNYHGAVKGEKQLLISGPVSLDTLRDILETYEGQVENLAKIGIVLSPE